MNLKTHPNEKPQTHNRVVWPKNRVQIGVIWPKTLYKSLNSCQIHQNYVFEVVIIGLYGPKTGSKLGLLGPRRGIDWVVIP
jgi:hypothetical protein